MHRPLPSTGRRNKAELSATPPMKDPVNLKLLELVRLRAAQIHHYASPVARSSHELELEEKGETADRLAELPDWETSSAFDDREKAALTLCDQISHDPEQALPEGLVRETLRHFTKAQMVRLTVAILAVNDWHFCAF